jgi:hypothetical protein
MISVPSRRRSGCSPTKLSVVTLLALALPGCAAKIVAPPLPAPLVACAPGEMPMAEFQLLLGRNIPKGGTVSDTAFRAFIDKAVVPAFPEGFTVSDAEGHYLHRNAKDPIREPSKIITIIATDSPDTGARIAAIAADYKRRFAQEAVGIIRQPACAAL